MYIPARRTLATIYVFGAWRGDRLMGWRRRLAATAATPLVLSTLLAGSASAAPPGTNVRPLDCLREFDHNPNYVGEGWIAAMVASANGYMLGCGNELSGVVHIAHPASTGTFHPIPANDEDLFLQCWRRTLEDGVPEPDGVGRTRYVYTHGYSKDRATVIVDDRGKFTYTMFTSDGSAGNNWLGCNVIEM